MQRLTRLSLTHPLATLAALAALTAVFGAGIPRLSTDVGYRSLLGSDHPAVVRFDAFLERFDGGFPLAAVWSCAQTSRCTSVFDDEALRMAADVALTLAGAPGIRRVDSPATTALLVPGEEEPIARTFVEGGRLAPDRAWLAERALHDSLWVRELVDAQGRVGAIVVDVASSGSGASVAAYDALDAALAPHERSGFRFHRVGGPVEFVVAGGELQADTAKLVPVMVVLVGAVLALLFHSLTFVCVALATVGLGVLWTFGLLGWLGWPQNTVSQALPPLLLVIGVCDVIHLLARYANDAGARPERDRATLLEDVAGDIGTACVATSLTTASGFASFATSGLESFVRFGAVAAFGVIAALILTFTLLPILAVRLRPNGARALRVSAVWSRVLERIVAVSEERATAVLALTTVLGMGAVVGVAMLRVDASFEDLYGEGSRVVRWSRFVGDALRRPDSGQPGSRDRAPRHRSTGRPGDARGRCRRAGLSGRCSRNRTRPLGDRRRLPGPPARERRRIVLVPRSVAQGRRTGDLRRPHGARRPRDRPLARRGGPALPHLHRVGEAPPGGDAAHLRRRARPARQRASQGLDGAPHGAARRGARDGGRDPAHPGLELRHGGARRARPLVPTLLPVVVTLGAMGLAGASLDVGSAMVAAVVIGIAVDDAIHLLVQYRRHRVAGAGARLAIRSAVLHVGRAVVSTSMALALGFFSLGFSSWKTISNFGALSGLAILVALLSVLVVLPALMVVATNRRHEPPRAQPRP
jgi:predicted RND superfamily exporter protein